MVKTIRVKCTNIRDCGHVNEFPMSDLVGDVAMEAEDGTRLDPPAVTEVDETTFVKCESCGYPINCADATISD